MKFVSSYENTFSIITFSFITFSIITNVHAPRVQSPIFTRREFKAPIFTRREFKAPIFTRREFNPPFSRAEKSQHLFSRALTKRKGGFFIILLKKKHAYKKCLKNIYNNFYSSLPYLKTHKTHNKKLTKRKKEKENLCLHYYNKRKKELRNTIAPIITRPPYSRKSPIITTALRILFLN